MATLHMQLHNSSMQPLAYALMHALTHHPRYISPPLAFPLLYVLVPFFAHCRFL